MKLSANTVKSLESMDEARIAATMLAAEVKEVIDALVKEAKAKADAEDRAAWDTDGSLRHIVSTLGDLLQGFEQWRK